MSPKINFLEKLGLRHVERFLSDDILSQMQILNMVIPKDYSLHSSTIIYVNEKKIL